MHSSIFDVMEFSELRLWALRGLAQNQSLISATDGTLFLAGECGYQIFAAVRSAVSEGVEMTPLSVGQRLGYDHKCLVGIVDVFFCGAVISERMAGVYLKKLAIRCELEVERAAA